MVKKPSSIRDTEQADSAPSVSRYFAPPEPVEPAPTIATVPRKRAKKPAVGWEATHQRWTFHAPVDVLDAIEAEAKRSNRTKTAVVVTLLRAGLNVPDPRP